MYNENSEDILKEMINPKNKINEKQEKRYSVFLESLYKSSDSKGDLMEKIKKLPTYKKICLLQGLLKEMKSIKERLEDNMDNMLKKISENCFYYYKSKIEMKEIYDYCQSTNREINLNYILCENSKEKLGRDYDTIYDMLFLLRENYDIMLLIINKSRQDYFESLANYLVNFFYENTVNSSFNEEELMILIYLLIEEFIMNKLPKSFNQLNNNNEFFTSGFLAYIFKFLTRKEDIRNFTCMILSSNILKLEESNTDLNIIIQKKENHNINYGEKINYNFPEINKFFYENDITLEYLNSKFKYYINNNSENNIINNVMKDYLELQINQIKTEKSEIYSNYIKIIELKNFISSKDKETADNIINLIIENYSKITKFIDDILDLFKNNLTSIPYILKSISFIFAILLNKKYSKENINYIKLFLLSDYFLGKIIIPLIENPDLNGIITTAVISKITRDNLKIISKIITTMLSGKLFSNKTEFEYTIFNKYIIDALPKIFNIIISVNLQKNFYLPNKIQTLINTCENINNKERTLEYDYFKENQEQIQQQSICFSLENLDVLIKTVCTCGDLFLSDKFNKNEELFKDFIKLSDLCKNNNNNIRKGDYFLIEKITYSQNFKNLVGNILQDNVFALMPNIKNDELSIFKNCLADLLAYVNILDKENFNYFMEITKTNSLLIKQNFKRKLQKILFDDDTKIELNNLKKILAESELNEENDEKKEADFKEIIFPQIIDIVKRELSNNIETDKAKRIVFCISYLQTHLSNLPLKYTENNYSLLLMEVIQKSEEIIQELNLSILNNFYLKVTGGEKLNMIISSNLLQIKKIEKWVCIEYLFENLSLPSKLTIKKENGVISKVEYTQVNSTSSNNYNIQSFINDFPDFRKYELFFEDIIELEEKIELDIALNSYFKDLKSLIKKEKIVERFTKDEIEVITQELENYILFKLFNKIFPKHSTKKDLKFYKKCCRLDFIKPENLIKNKNMINENLWKTSMILINEMDNKLTPADKVKSFGKAFTIIHNSIIFCSGKNDLGIDDTIPFLIYVILKSKPKNIFTNSKFCQLLLNPDLAKKQYGILLSQMEMVKNIIFDMKYTDLINVTEEQFGKD